MKGLSEQTVREISAQKHEPSWMLEKRLEALEIFRALPDPNFGPDLSALDLDKIEMYVKPEAKLTTDWRDVPPEILQTFEALGIPESERADGHCPGA